jgi:uncharacterized glyoxalase superfamily protein PhnB
MTGATMTALTPHIVAGNAKAAAEWSHDVFDAEIGSTISAPDGREDVSPDEVQRRATALFSGADT